MHIPLYKISHILSNITPKSKKKKKMFSKLSLQIQAARSAIKPVHQSAHTAVWSSRILRRVYIHINIAYTATHLYRSVYQSQRKLKKIYTKKNIIFSGNIARELCPFLFTLTREENTARAATSSCRIGTSRARDREVCGIGRARGSEQRDLWAEAYTHTHTHTIAVIRWCIVAARARWHGCGTLRSRCCFRVQLFRAPSRLYTQHN